MESVLPLLLKNTFGSMKNNLLYPLSLKGEKSGLKSISRKEEKRNAEKYSANTIGKGQTIKDPY